MKKVLIILALVIITTTVFSTGFNPTFYHTGFNYYSHPLNLNNLDWREIRFALCNNSNVAENLAGNCTQVYFYNSTEQQWKMWDINKADTENTLINAESGYGYLINVTDEGMMNLIDGGQTVDPISYSKWSDMQLGWNLMGWTTADVNMNISEAVKLIYGNWSKNITRVWGYENNTDIMKPLWPEDPNSQFQAWLHAYWVCVENDSNRGYCETSEPPLMPWQNKRPELFNGSVNNTNLTTTDDLEFTVYYKDADNDAPALIQVVIDGVEYNMTEETNTYNETQGAGYTLTITRGAQLASGNHTYYFKARDATNHIYYDGTDATKYPKVPVENQLVYHVNFPPIASFTSPDSVFSGQEILFNASSSYDLDGFIVSYEWNFGDGETSFEQSPLHVFKTAGNYSVSLTVTDNKGEKNTAIKIVEVKTLTKPKIKTTRDGMQVDDWILIHWKKQPPQDPDKPHPTIANKIKQFKKLEIKRRLIPLF